MDGIKFESDFEVYETASEGEEEISDVTENQAVYVTCDC